MGTTSITERHTQAVGLWLQGFIEEQIIEQVADPDATQLIAEAAKIWGATKPSALRTIFVDSLPPDERARWNAWAVGLLAYLPMSTQAQRQLLAALAAETTADYSLSEMAKYLGIDEETLSEDLDQMLNNLPGIETRTGLTTVCYLVKHAAAPLKIPIESLPRPDLQNVLMKTLRLVARGLTNQAISVALGIPASTVARHIRILIAAFGVNKRTQLALIYLLSYLSAEERAAWRSEVTFQWPYEGQTQFNQLQLLLTWEYCHSTNTELGRLLFVTRHTVKTYGVELADRLVGWPRTRTAVMVAAALHMPER